MSVRGLSTARCTRPWVPEGPPRRTNSGLGLLPEQHLLPKSSSSHPKASFLQQSAGKQAKEQELSWKILKPHFEVLNPGSRAASRLCDCMQPPEHQGSACAPRSKKDGASQGAACSSGLHALRVCRIKDVWVCVPRVSSVCAFPSLFPNRLLSVLRHIPGNSSQR